MRYSVFVVEQVLRQHFFDDLLDAELLDVHMLRFRRVLRRNDDVGNRHRLVVFIDHRHLRLRVRAQPRHLAALADAREFAPEPVREHDRRRHQFRRLVARVAEHQALVARALLRVLLALGLARVHTLRDVRRLAGENDIHEHLVRMEHVVVVHVADLANGLARDFDHVDGVGRILESRSWEW